MLLTPGFVAAQDLEVDIPALPNAAAATTTDELPSSPLEDLYKELGLDPLRSGLLGGPAGDTFNHTEEALIRYRETAARAVLAGRLDEADERLALIAHRRLAAPADMVLWATTKFFLGEREEARRILRLVETNRKPLASGRFLKLCLDVKDDGPLTNGRAYWQGRPLDELEALAAWLHRQHGQIRQQVSEAEFGTVCDTGLGKGTAAKLPQILDSLRRAREKKAQSGWGDALVFFDLARSHGLESISIYQAMAECRLEMKDFGNAAKIVKGLLDRYPRRHDLWFNYGYLLMQSGDFVEAEAAFRKTSDLRPAIGFARFGIACALAAQDKLDVTWPILNELATSHPKFLGEWLKGETPWLQAIHNHPNYAELVGKLPVLKPLSPEFRKKP